MNARRRLLSAALSVSLVAVVAASVTPTAASWRDDEWVSGSVGTLDCGEPDTHRTRGAGRLLGGGLLPLDLDAVATVGGVTATNDGTRSRPQPAAAAEVGPDAYSNPLDVSALGLVDLPLTGGALDGLLELPLGTDVGVLNQWARASADGTSAGASGVVNDSGVIDTSDDPGTGEPPELGTLRLSTLVSELTGEAVGDVVTGLTDLSLEIGAVAGRAALDACPADWTGDLDAHLTREYAIAGLDAVVESGLISDVATTAEDGLRGVETLVDGLASDAGLVPQLTGALTDIINAVPGLGELGLISIDTVAGGPTVTIDLSAVRSLLASPIQDEGEIVTIDLAAGRMRVDLARLLGRAYGGADFAGNPGAGLNGLPPNTELILNEPVVTELTAAVTAALDDWASAVIEAAEHAVHSAGVDLNLTATVRLLTQEIISVGVTVDDSQLGSLLGMPGFPPADIAISVTSLLGSCNPLFPLSLACLVDGLLGGITAAVTEGIGPAVGRVLEEAILVPVVTLGSTLDGVAGPVVQLLGEVLGTYLGVNGVVSLRANIQNDAAAGNDPDPTTPPYADWESGILAVPEGRYDVAALGVGVLNALGPGLNVNLELGRGSVGVNCRVGDAAACAGY